MARAVGTKLVLGLLYVVVMAICIAPFLWQINTAFKLDRDINSLPPIFPPEVTFSHFANVFSVTFMRFIVNSVIVSVGVTVICLFIGSMAAYAITRMPIKGGGIILALFLATSMFPQISVVMPIYMLIREIGLYNTHPGLIFAYMLFCLPMSVWLLSGFFRELPKELEEAAAIDGCGTFRMYGQIILPIIMPGLVTAGLLVFIASWNEFLFALTLTNNIQAQTIPVGIAFFPQTYFVPWGDISAASVVVTLPLILIVVLFEGRLTKGLVGGAVKG